MNIEILPLILYSVLFLHGLGGHAYGSWLADDGCWWPLHRLAAQYTRYRILCYGYNARLSQMISFESLTSFAETLVSLMLSSRDIHQVGRTRNLPTMGRQLT